MSSLSGIPSIACSRILALRYDLAHFRGSSRVSRSGFAFALALAGRLAFDNATISSTLLVGCILVSERTP